MRNQTRIKNRTFISPYLCFSHRPTPERSPLFADLLIATNITFPTSSRLCKSVLSSNSTQIAKALRRYVNRRYIRLPLPSPRTSPNVRRNQMSRSETRLRIRYPYDDSSLHIHIRVASKQAPHNLMLRATVLFVPLYSQVFLARKPRLLSTDSSHHRSRDRGRQSYSI